MMNKDADHCTMFAKNLVLRIALGGMLLLYGVAKFKMGVSGFAAEMSSMFDATVIPVGLARAFLTVVPLLEVVLGALILLGLYTRYAALTAAFLFAFFIVGLTSTGNNELLVMNAANYIYIFAAFFLAHCPHSTWSLDHVMCKGGKCKI